MIVEKYITVILLFERPKIKKYSSVFETLNLMELQLLNTRKTTRLAQLLDISSLESP